MQSTPARVAAILCVLLLSRAAVAACPVDRAPVKAATDADAASIRLLVMPATIESLHALPAPRPLPYDRRVMPIETTIYSVTATLVAYRVTPESEIHLVLSDETGRTIVAKLPSLACASGSRFASEIASARFAFQSRFVAADAFKEARQAIEVRGVGLFDFLQGQRGLAPNGLSLHPVTSVNFNPLTPPKPPSATRRRRSVAPGGGGSACTLPTLSLFASPTRTCAGGSVAVSWHASDAAAKVTIDGIGVALPASGSRTFGATASSSYSGRAVTSCGTSHEAVASVTVSPAATASLNGPHAMTTGSSATLSAIVTGASSWTLTSSLGNAISPSSGTSTGTATYSPSRAGTDVITLSASGGCGALTRTLTITVTAPSTPPPPPPPPPPSGGLLCCDGTRSPSCFSCSNKRGCCSNHGGVCGCP